MAGIFPILNGKVLDVNVPSAIGRLLLIDYFDGGFVVFVNGGWLRDGETEICKNSAQVDGGLRCGNGSQECSLGRACGGAALSFALVSNGGA